MTKWGQERMEESSRVFLEMPFFFLVDVTEITRATRKKRIKPNPLMLCHVKCVISVL